MILTYINLQENKSYKIAVIIFVVAAMLCIFPIGVIKEDRVSFVESANAYYPSDFISETNTYTQEFIPQYNHITAIGIDLQKDEIAGLANQGTLHFVITNDQGKEVFSTSVELAQIPDKTYYDITVNKWLWSGKTYRYTISVSGCEELGPRIRYGETGDLGVPENQAVTMGGEVYSEYSSVVQYTYRAYPGVDDIVVYYVFLWMIGSILIYLPKMKNRKQ